MADNYKEVEKRELKTLSISFHHQFYSYTFDNLVEKLLHLQEQNQSVLKAVQQDKTSVTTPHRY